MSDYPMLISNKLHSFRNFRLQIYRFLAKLRKVSTKSSAARLKNTFLKMIFKNIIFQTIIFKTYPSLPRTASGERSGSMGMYRTCR